MQFGDGKRSNFNVHVSCGGSEPLAENSKEGNSRRIRVKGRRGKYWSIYFSRRVNSRTEILFSFCVANGSAPGRFLGMLCNVYDEFDSEFLIGPHPISRRGGRKKRHSDWEINSHDISRVLKWGGYDCEEITRDYAPQFSQTWCDHLFVLTSSLPSPPLMLITVAHLLLAVTIR